MQRCLRAFLSLSLVLCIAAAPLEGLETDPASIPHPVILPDQHWPGAVVIAILGWILTCAVIGVVIRTNAPEDTFPTYSRQEPPGAFPNAGK